MKLDFRNWFEIGRRWRPNQEDRHNHLRPALVIPCQNDTDLLVRLLDRARALDCFAEIIIVDDASDIPIEDALSGQDDLQIIRNSKPFGGGVARNRGLQAVSADHVLFFDADDLVSKHLAKEIETVPDDEGRYIQEGYQVKSGSGSVKIIPHFYKHCGTSVIHPASHLSLDPGIDEFTPQEKILELIESRTLQLQLGSHRFVHLFYGDRVTFEPVSFPAAMWVLGTGENHSGKGGEKGSMPISDELIDDFSIPDSYLSLNP